MTDDYSSLAQDVEKKFLDWFGDPVPTEASLPAEAGHSIENSVPTDPPHIADANHINHRTHRTRKRQVAHSTKLLGMLFFGFIGAVSSGIGAYFFLYNSIKEGWYSDNWLSQSNVILFATFLGFGFGLFIFYIILQEEK